MFDFVYVRMIRALTAVQLWFESLDPGDADFGDTCTTGSMHLHRGFFCECDE